MINKIELRDYLSEWQAATEKEGLIPTVELLIEELSKDDSFFPPSYEDFAGTTDNPNR
jgi:hypothetical protein